MASNEKLILIDWSGMDKSNNNDELISHIYSIADKIKIQICYESIHGDGWLVSRTGFKTDKELNKREVQKNCDFTQGEIFLE